MKVLMVTTGMDIGGAETHISELCFAFRKRGIQVFVASAGGVYVSRLRKNGIPHITLPLNRKTPAALRTALKGLEDLIRREKFDIVHAHARIPAFLCGKLRRRFGFHFVTTDHLDFRLNPLWKRLTDWGEFTFAVSEDLRGYLMKNYRLPPERIALTVNGIDTERFSPRKINTSLRERLQIGDRTAVLHISRLEKHLALCVRALMGAVQILGGQVSLIVAGDGSCAPILREEARSLNETLGYPAVIFAGAVTDVENYIAASDIVVSPSRAAMEAMACAKLTVVCGSQGYGGIFGDGIVEEAVKSNFCFRGSPLPTASLLAGDIRAILRMDESEKIRLKNFARRFICENYSVDVMAQTQLDGYRRLLGEREAHLYDIMICGYYGYGNMGDETLLSVITGELRRQKNGIKLCVLSADPEKTQILHHVDAVPRFDLKKISRAMDRSGMLLFGGGNLLQDKTSTHSLLYYTHILRMAKKRGMKILIYANGIGPLRREENRKRTKAALALADEISLRDPASFAFVGRELPEKTVRLTFDPAILAEKTDFPIPGPHYFIVAPKRFSAASEESLVRLIRALAEKTEMTPVLVSLYDRQDMAYVKKISSVTGASVCAPRNAGECISLFASAKLVISSRLHGLVYATAARCPMMGYSDDEKLFSYLAHIGFGTDAPVSCGIAAEESADAVIERAMLILDQSEYCKRILSQSLDDGRSLAQNEIAEVIRLTDFSGKRAENTDV